MKLLALLLWPQLRKHFEYNQYTYALIQNVTVDGCILLHRRSYCRVAIIIL